MKKNLTKNQTGKIIFWNNIYGFIQQHDNSSIFFHKNDIISDTLELLDVVSYNSSQVEKGKHKGKPIAVEIQKNREANLSEYTRYIGKLTQWNNHFGYIVSPQQDKTVLFYKTRSLIKDTSYNEGDLLVFHQVKSVKDNNQLFALFAYPISQERNIIFLQRQYSDSLISEIKYYINQLLAESTDLSIEEKFYHEISSLDFVNNNDSYLKLVSIIKDAKEKNYVPKIDLIGQYCDQKYLIQLWEEEIIDEYEIEITKPYFHNTLADNKRYLISKMQNDDKKEILLYHFKKLKSEGKLLNLNNSVKTLLDIVYRNCDSRVIELYHSIKEHLIQNLSPEDIINLWLNGYLDYLTEGYILVNVDINNHQTIQTLLNKTEDKYREALMKIYENYFLNITKSDFDDELPQLVKRLKIFNKEYNNRYQEIISAIENILGNDKIFTLWVFGVSIDFDATQYFVNNHQQINDYYKARFLLLLPSNTSKELILSLLEIADISQQGLINFTSNVPWNMLVSPTNSEPKTDNIVFLQDIQDYIDKFKITSINIYDLSVHIYHSLSKFQVHHIRLWLYGFVDDSLYDFVGFREVFKELTSDEQSIFKKKGDFSSYNTYVYEPEFHEVEPCLKIISEKGKTKTYLALIPNLYFSKGYIQLRIEDGSYTDKRMEPYASSGLNRIPSTSDFTKLPIEIEVLKENNKILTIKGLNEIFTLIHTGEIEKTLGISSEANDNSSYNRNKSYVEDWQLRKKILDFLNNNQTDLLEPKTVYEPKNFFRKLDMESGTDAKELTRLYSIDTTDGYGIIWENIDLTEDRATYIFKSDKQSHHSQLEKIAKNIVSVSQLRSTLISSEEQDQLQLFKNNLGYIASIRKQRGKNESFENWRGKLENYLSKPIPVIPSDELLESLKQWFPKKSSRTSSIKIKRSNIPKPINEKETTIIDSIPELNPPISNQKKEDSKRNREQLFKALKTFNNSFLENFKLTTDGR